MGRLAGNSTHYNLVVVDKDGKPVDAHRVAFLDKDGNVTEHTLTLPAELALPSVTSILDAVIAKPNLYGWYYSKGIEGVEELFRKFGEKLPRDADSLKQLLREEELSPFARRDVAAVRGRDIHSDMEDLARGDKVARTDDTAGLLDWWKKRKPEVEACELPIASIEHGYAGTIDLVYVDPKSGARVLCDLKTGSGVYWTHFLQGEAYRLAYEARTGTRVDRVSVLHAPAKGVLKGRTFREVIAPEVTVDDFLKVLAIYNSMPKKVVLEDVA